MLDGNVNRVATIGTYDGVHTGHREVTETVMQLARRHNLSPAVFVFATHPLDVIAPHRVPERLMNPADRKKVLEEIGLEVFTIDFTPEMSRLTSREYMKILHDTYGVRMLVVGYDNRFGSDRDSSFDDYVREGRELGIEVVKAMQRPDVSSSIIRRLLREGKVKEAAKALGYTYSLTGSVEHGQALGKTIGFPTANIEPHDSRRLVPADGVYAAFATLSDGTRRKAMVNIGVRPTVTGSAEAQRSIEAHIIDFSGNLYGKEIRLEFIERMRDERKMQSLDDLKSQLAADRNQAAALLP